MESLLEHLKIATRMNENKLNLELIRNFTIERLEKACLQLEQTQINADIYYLDKIIQKEIIKDTKSIEYFTKMYEEKVDFLNLNKLITIIQDQGEKITDYDLEDVIEIIRDSNFNEQIGFLYLKYFSGKIKSKIGKKIVIQNIKYFITGSSSQLENLSNQEIELFTKPYMSDYNLIPIHYVRNVYELLAKNSKLRELIYFLFKNRLTLPLGINEYEKLNQNPNEIKKYIQRISNLIDNETLYRLLLRWKENGCTLYDLKILENKIIGIEKSKLENIVTNRSGYINFIFGNKISKMKLNDLNTNQENIVIYAIRNNKKGFLKLIQENQMEFFQIPRNSIIYEEEVYSKYLNINALNRNNLKELQYMNENKSYFYLLEDYFVCTFNELKALYNSKNASYYSLYNHFRDLKIDERLIRIKQLINKNLLNKEFTDENIRILGEMLNIKPLYDWLEKDFLHIKGMTLDMAIKVLIDYKYVKQFICEVKNINELAYLLRNKEIIPQYNTFQDMKNSIEEIDKSWQELKNIMQLRQDFIEKYQDTIKTFLLKNGAEIAVTYYNELRSDRKKEAYKLILKSELMGEFNRLKYFANDLSKEISFELKTFQIDEWTKNNIQLSADNIIVKEQDDFFHTMILGLQPRRTCLSYIDGMYNQCLLACFDSNKKIIYAKSNGKIVGRAMIRLTKGTYQDTRKTNSLTFVDMEDVENQNEIPTNREEILTIFLEKAYIASVSPKVEQKIKRMFMELVKQKAQKLNALLVLSNSYKDCSDEEYVYTQYYMYISKSKAGSQYLDSLSGQATVSDEGQYRYNNFLIWKPDMRQAT